MNNGNRRTSQYLGGLLRHFTNNSVLERNMLLFTYEGILFALINNLIANNNNLFATRLGATDFEISLVIALPQFVSMLVLIPGGVLADRLTNKRRMVVSLLFCLALAYGLIGFVPMLGSIRLTAFLALLALSSAPLTLYNSTWQAYFSDVVPIDQRNKAFTMRTKWGFLVSILIPLATGLLLAAASRNADKIMLHQSFFWISAVLLVLQALVLGRTTGGNVRSQVRMSLKDLKAAAAELAHNRKFITFVGIALFFYVTWQADWAIFYLGEVNYLKMNEAWLSYQGISSAVIQFLTAGFWSRVNERFGVRFSMIFGSVSLLIWPVNMIISLSLPCSEGRWAFILLSLICNLPFAVVSLNIYQCLLQVVPEINKTLSISIYTVMIALSNAVMPMVGVQLYTALGADRNGMRLTFLILFAARAVAVSLWIIRWHQLRNEPK